MIFWGRKKERVFNVVGVMGADNNELSWKDYFLRHSLGDLIADGLGIITGLMLDFWPSGKPEEDKETKDFSDMTDFEELGMSYHKT